jgi:hypothetical protein
LPHPESCPLCDQEDETIDHWPSPCPLCVRKRILVQSVQTGRSSYPVPLAYRVVLPCLVGESSQQHRWWVDEARSWFAYYSRSLDYMEPSQWVCFWWSNSKFSWCSDHRRWGTPPMVYARGSRAIFLNCPPPR